MRKNKNMCTCGFCLPQKIQGLHVTFLESVESLAPAIHASKRTDDGAARDRVLAIYGDAIRIASDLEKYFTKRAHDFSDKQVDLSRKAESYRIPRESTGINGNPQESTLIHKNQQRIGF